MTRRKEVGRDRILEAAEAVILDSGGRHLTLDAVAERAGISKGGLTYSFPTKDALVAAALEREIARFEATVAARIRSPRDGRPERLLAYVEAMLDEDEPTSRRAAFLMTSLLHRPEMLEPVRGYYRKLFALFSAEAGDEPEARQAILAVEGVFLLRGLNLVSVGEGDWRSILTHARETLLRRTEGVRCPQGE